MDEKNKNTKEKYKLEMNENQEITIKKIDKEKNKEIEIIFETEEKTNIMTKVLKELSEYFVDEILKNDN